MQWGLVLTVPPAEEPVSLDEAKLHLRVEHNDEDALISALITAAREYAEDVQRRAYVTQTWQLTLDRFPCGKEIRLPRPPLQSVTAITYVDADGGEQTLAPSNYVVDTAAEPGRVVLVSGVAWPATAEVPAAVRVTYVAGYGAAAAVPAQVRQALLLLIAHWYEHREAVSGGVGGAGMAELPLGTQAILRADRVFPFDPVG